jgi:hypothetical protein
MLRNFCKKKVLISRKSNMKLSSGIWISIKTVKLTKILLKSSSLIKSKQRDKQDLIGKLGYRLLNLISRIISMDSIRRLHSNAWKKFMTIKWILKWKVYSINLTQIKTVIFRTKSLKEEYHRCTYCKSGKSTI